MKHNKVITNAFEIATNNSSYNELTKQLTKEQKSLLFKAYLEIQMLTIAQCIYGQQDLVCDRYVRNNCKWLSNIIDTYSKERQELKMSFYAEDFADYSQGVSDEEYYLEDEDYSYYEDQIDEDSYNYSYQRCNVYTK